MIEKQNHSRKRADETSTAREALHVVPRLAQATGFELWLCNPRRVHALWQTTDQLCDPTQGGPTWTEASSEQNDSTG